MYEDSSSIYSLDAYFDPFERLGLHGGVTYTSSKGTFSPNAADLLVPVSVASFGDFKFSETVLTASGRFTVAYGFAVTVDYKYSDLDEELFNPHDSIKDGEAHIGMVALEWKWN
jgi:hypothetical protein